MTEKDDKFYHKIDKSAVLTVIGIILLFSTSVAVILIAPSLVDPTWTSPTSSYQVQMYEVSDPNFYLGTTYKGSTELEAVYHLKKDFTLLAFQESDILRIVSPPEFEKFITKAGEPIKLTTTLLMLRKPNASADSDKFKAMEAAEKLRKDLRQNWEKENPDWKEESIPHPSFDIFELYAPGGTEAFALAPADTSLENWVDPGNFSILEGSEHLPYDTSQGTIYINNPVQFRLKEYKFGDEVSWHYDPNGKPIKNMEELKSHPLTFMSRHELIQTGEHTFAVEGCWYCHTDQTRTLVQDVVLNGSAAFPAPPSSANEYIYQKITFPGTKRNGPDLSRTGVKRPSRDWHRGHFWSPKTASEGSIMPSFKHFFDNDPRGTLPSVNIPNYKFEAVYQYLMTKGTRITPPTQAWWLGKDPIDTKAIIEGRKSLEK